MWSSFAPPGKAFRKTASWAKAIKAAINWIKSIASEPEVGQIYDGTVVKTVDFGGP